MKTAEEIYRGKQKPTLGYWMIPITDEMKASVEEGLPLFQDKARPRGFFDPERMRITLTKRKDPSTIIHESAHFFLTVMEELPKRIRASRKT